MTQRQTLFNTYAIKCCLCINIRNGICIRGSPRNKPFALGLRRNKRFPRHKYESCAELPLVFAEFFHLRLCITVAIIYTRL